MTVTTPIYDFAIVGAGMAGASLAAELGGSATVAMLEAEDQAGYHATGRSAAFWEECYGGPDIVPLTLASGPFLNDGGFLTRRGALYIGRDEDSAQLGNFLERFERTGATISRVERDQIAAKIPALKPGWTGAIWEPACADIDVGSLHAHYLSAAARAGAVLTTRFRAASLTMANGVWTIVSEAGGALSARRIINAAGAWADQIAALAGCRPIGIAPLRRTVVQLRTDPQPAAEMPLVLDVSGRFYFKPEAGRVWLSPHDETPSEPCDAAPEELAVAEAIERLESVVDWNITAVERKWAGLRSFTPDRLPIYGTDPRNPDFIWFAGQGGFGIQTAPAAARLLAARLLGNKTPNDLAAIDVTKYAADRFG